jgi:hypothetical protein
LRGCAPEAQTRKSALDIPRRGKSKRSTRFSRQENAPRHLGIIDYSTLNKLVFAVAPGREPQKRIPRFGAPVVGLSDEGLERLFTGLESRPLDCGAKVWLTTDQLEVRPVIWGEKTGEVEA